MRGGDRGQSPLMGKRDGGRGRESSDDRRRKGGEVRREGEVGGRGRRWEEEVKLVSYYTIREGGRGLRKGWGGTEEIGKGR